MKKENNNPRFVYPMSELNKMFTEEEVAKMSEAREFSREDEMFHFNECEGWIESFNEDDFNAYNGAMPKNKILLKVAA